MTGPELAAALDRLGLSQRRFARFLAVLAGRPEQPVVVMVNRWVKGRHDGNATGTAPIAIAALVAVLERLDDRTRARLIAEVLDR